MLKPRGLYGMVDVVTGEGAAEVHDRVSFLRDLGVVCFQLRAKHLDAAEVLALAERYAGSVDLVINDHVDVAAALGLAAHVGQGDGPDPEVLFGRSTHTLAQVGAPGGAAYIGFGPVFGTATKQSEYSARGLAMLAEAVRVAQVPVVAIGGITGQRLPALRDTGVAAWAMISGFWAWRRDAAAIRALCG